MREKSQDKRKIKELKTIYLYPQLRYHNMKQKLYVRKTKIKRAREV